MIQILNEKTGGNVEILSQLVPGVRGLSGVMVLAGSGAVDYAAAFTKVSDAAGKTDRDIQTMADTTTERMNQVSSIWNQFLSATGQTVTGIAGLFAGAVDGALKFGQSLTEKVMPGVLELSSLQEKSNETIEDWNRLAELAVQAALSLGTTNDEVTQQQIKSYEEIAVNADAEIVKLKAKQALLEKRVDAELKAEQKKKDDIAALDKETVDARAAIQTAGRAEQNTFAKGKINTIQPEGAFV